MDLQTFVRSQKPLLLVIGERHSGKSKTLNDIVSQLKVSRHIIRMQGTPNIHPNQLATLLSKHWAAKISDEHARLENQLHEIVLGLSKHSQDCILLIDDAHLLSFSVLAAISHLANMQEHMKVHLHIVLSGHNPLINRMQSLQTRKIPVIQLGEASEPMETPTPAPKEKPADKPLSALSKKIKPAFSGKRKVKVFSFSALIVLSYFMMWFFNQPETNPTGEPLFSHASKTHPAIPQPSNTQTPRHIAMTQELPQLTAPTDAHTLAQNTPALAQPQTSTPSIAVTSVTPAPVKTGFTLQLMASHNRKVLEAFSYQHHLAQARIQKTHDRGQEWYVLTTGHFASKQEAGVAIHSMNPTVQKLHPWIRRENSLHT